MVVFKNVLYFTAFGLSCISLNAQELNFDFNSVGVERSNGRIYKISNGGQKFVVGGIPSDSIGDPAYDADDVRLDTSGFRHIDMSANFIRLEASLGSVLSSCSPDSKEFNLELLFNAESFLESTTDDDRMLSIGRVNNDGDFNSLFSLRQIYNAGPFLVADEGIQTKENALYKNADSGVNAQPIDSFQRLVYTVNRLGEAKLYLSDRDGYMVQQSRGEAPFSKLDDLMKNDVHLYIGNDPSVDSGTDASHWKGKVKSVKLGCSSLSLTQINGLPDPTNVQITDSNMFDEVSGSQKTASVIFTRITGKRLSVDHPSILAMAQKIDSGDLEGAAAIATSDPGFINRTVKDFGARMSTREETVDTVLNDFTATIMGLVRDDRSAQEMLTGNYIYKASPASGAPQNMNNDILMSNNHYSALEKLANEQGVDISAYLEKVPQMLTNGRDDPLVHEAPAGLLTSRSFMGAHHILGTGRRPVEYTFRNFLCLGIDEIASTRGPDNRIGRDITRLPSGEHQKFEINCKSCHVPMDGFRDAFSRYDFDGGYVNYGPVIGFDKGKANFDSNMFVRTVDVNGVPQWVSYKFANNNDVAPAAHVTVDNSFKNYANLGKNANLIGWSDTSDGKGLPAFARQVAGTEAFPRCMAKRVFASVCKREATPIEDNFIDQKAVEFKTDFNLKKLFQRVVTSKECIGDV
ncbi:MAG: hypothetical protein AB8E15_06275 [Bdellovibrionales bacterium]